MISKMKSTILLSVAVLLSSLSCEGADLFGWFGGAKKQGPETYKVTLVTNEQAGKILSPEEESRNFGFVSPTTFNRLFDSSKESFGYLRLYSEMGTLQKNYERDRIHDSQGILSIQKKTGISENHVVLSADLAGYIRQVDRQQTGTKSNGSLNEIEVVPLMHNVLEPAGYLHFNVYFSPVLKKNHLVIHRKVVEAQLLKKFQGLVLTKGLNGLKFVFTEEELKSQVYVNHIEATLTGCSISKYVDTSSSIRLHLQNEEGIELDYAIPRANSFNYLVKKETKFLSDETPFEVTQMLQSLEALKERDGQSGRRKRDYQTEEDSGHEDDPQITNLNLDFKALGIGGLEQPLRELVRNAVLSRGATKETLQRLDIKEHTKGILLYGPPGTGKTLIARKIAEMLGVESKYFIVINGPEILNKYIGESERRIRELFELAEQHPHRLIVLFFDEFDAIASSRTAGNGAGDKVGNNIVNQLLSKMDGVHAINNVLIIGATNRKELIDPALLREGRLSIHLAINLPDEKGRREIFNIHLKENIENKVLKGVDVEELVQRTPNYSGAEIKGLCKRARDFALQESIVDPKDLAKVNPAKLFITRSHFLAALEQIKPVYGQQLLSLDSALPAHDIFLSSQVDFVEHLIQRMLTFRSGKVSSILITGPMGSGKSAIAGCFVDKSKQHFDLTRILAPTILTKSFVDDFEQAWLDAQRVKKALIVLDGLEHLLGMLNVYKYDDRAMRLLNTILASKTQNKIVILSTMQTESKDLFGQINMSAQWSMSKIVKGLIKKDLEQILLACNITKTQVTTPLMGFLIHKSLSTVLDICKDEKASSNGLTEWQSRLSLWD